MSEQVGQLVTLGKMKVADAVNRVEPTTLSVLNSLLEQATIADSGWCEVHQKLCPLHDTAESNVTGNAAGWTCVDFSRRGKRRRLTGTHVVDYKCWEAERKQRREDWIFGECVAGHPSKRLLDEAIGDTHHCLGV